MQNKNTIWVLTGVAIVAAAGVAGITRDKWMGTEPAAVTAPEVPKVAEQPAPAPEPAPAPATQTAEQPAPAAPAESSAAPAEPVKQAEAPAATESASTQPAATVPAATVPAATVPAATPETTTAAAQPEPQPASNAEAKPEVPTFDTVNVQKTGEAVIAGRAEPGSDVTLKLDGKEIGKTTANTDGAFVVVPEQPLPAGSGALTIESQGKGDKEATASEQSVAVIVPAGQPQDALVAVVSPDQPTKILQKPAPAPEAPAATPEQPKPAKLVSIDAVDYDTKGNIMFSGQGDQGNTARVYVDNSMVGDAPVGADGHWTYSGTADITPGKHTLRVDGLDAEGKVVNRVEVPFVREEQSKVAEAAPAETAPAETAPAEPAPAETTATKTEPAPAASGTAEQPAAQPEAPAAPATAAAKPKEGRVVIQPGNNLWRISRVLYGSGAKYTMLYEANKDQIRNPDMIYPGQVFKTPSIAAKSETVDPHRREPLKPEESDGSAQ